jgi:PP-loop superfamily ATP-utilizing enzyme
MLAAGLNGPDLAAAERVADLLRGSAPLGVAFSGGVDSSTLLALAARALGTDMVLGLLAVPPSLAEDDRLAAHRVADYIGGYRSLRWARTKATAESTSRMGRTAAFTARTSCSVASPLMWCPAMG